MFHDSILRGAIALASVVATSAIAQNCAWSHIDHRVSYDASGVWNAKTYRDIVATLTVAEVGAAVWEGSESRFGKTLWQGIDSELLADVGAEAGKHVITRVRPSSENNPCLWFQAGSNRSFPSGEAAVAAGLVSPNIFEYGSEYPATYLLALLPLYVGSDRLKNQAHWQTDVLAGWAVGGVSG
jgi:undecaprenyl-diphosphatase